MFTFFRRKKDKPSVMYGVFQQLGTAIESRQRKAADYLNNRTIHWNDRHILIWFSLLTVFLGGGAVIVVWQSFQQPAHTVRIEPIRVQTHGWQGPRERMEAGLSNAASHNLHSFRGYLDSLQQTATGQKVYDSIAQYRPGLLDSLTFIEKHINNN